VWTAPGRRSSARSTSTEQASPDAGANPTTKADATTETPTGVNLDPWPELSWYAWVADAASSMPRPIDTVRGRYVNSLPGYSVFGGEPESYSEWLRLLPLAGPGTPVRNYRGDVVVPGDDEYLAAVVAIDVGSDNLQKSTDVALRLHAEWRWFVRDHAMLYLTDSRFELPLKRWQAGDELSTKGLSPNWKTVAAPHPRASHADFRVFLDQIFALSDCSALVAESDPVVPERVEPGDFLLHRGRDPEVLMVLDVAKSRTGDRAVMLARSRNPAENIHIIRPNRASLWFPMRPAQPLRVARSQPFNWRELRRLRALRSTPNVACVGSMCPPTSPPPNKTLQ